MQNPTLPTNPLARAFGPALDHTAIIVTRRYEAGFANFLSACGHEEPVTLEVAGMAVRRLVFKGAIPRGCVDVFGDGVAVQPCTAQVLANETSNSVMPDDMPEWMCRVLANAEVSRPDCFDELGAVDLETQDTFFSGGYIKLWRSVRDQPWWKNPRQMCFMLDGLLQARRMPQTVRVGDLKITLPRGSLFTTINQIAENMKIPREAARSVIRSLVKHGAITVNYVSGSGGSTVGVIVSFSRFDDYSPAIVSKPVRKGKKAWA